MIIHNYNINNKLLIADKIVKIFAKISNGSFEKTTLLSWTLSHLRTALKPSSHI